MQTSPVRQSLENYEFRFVSILASHADGQNGETPTPDLAAVADLGADGWEIRGVTADPRMPAARLLIALQRKRS